MADWLIPFAAILMANGFLPHGLTGELVAFLAGPPAAYDAGRRSVSNWRREAVTSLSLQWPAQWNFTVGALPERLPRCIRLNNYWCIKRAGWDGEIAADGEGHVAFSSVEEGALVAASLLRRYYVDYRLVTAKAIVARWAPGECAIGAGPARQTLARAGLQNTLRARWLARNRPGFTGKAPKAVAAARRSVIAERPVPVMRAPAIAVGMGERPPASSMNMIAAIDRAPLRAARASCPSETARMGNYASRIADSLQTGADDDLRLFDTQGMPTPRLEAALSAMSGVEIGPYAVDPAVVSGAVEALQHRLRTQKANSEPAGGPGL